MIRENNGWISVKDALPEAYRAVLVINSEEYFLASIRSDGEFHLSNFSRVYDVTHWQPLHRHQPNQIAQGKNDRWCVC